MEVSDTVIYQDNHISMKLEKDRISSSGKQTQHINIRYNFVTDCIQENKTKVEYFPMEIRIAYFYTKPLQVKLFSFFRNIILNPREEEISNMCQTLGRRGIWSSCPILGYQNNCSSCPP